MNKYFPYIVLISALCLAGCAAYYSVYGLSKLFSAQAFAVIIMASILEGSKLVTATYLHRYWKKLNLLLKSYLTIAVIVLMMITSLGIYGFLTSAYQTTSDELTILDKQISVIEMKKQRFVDQLSLKIESLTDSVTKLDLQVLDINSNSELTAEVGPLKYISNVTGYPMDNIVNYFVLAFIFVFDPLAVLLLISANKAFKLNKDKNMNNKGEYDHLKDWVDIKEEQMKDTAFRDFQKQQDENDKKFEQEKNIEPSEDIYKEKQEEKKPTENKRNAYWT